MFSVKSKSVHVDSQDDQFFHKIKDWWNPNGSMYTLHYYNDFRIRYLKKLILDEGLVSKQSNQSKLSNEKIHTQPFENLNILDIGCGGGLLCESMARLGGQVIGIDSNQNSFEIAQTHLETYQGEEKEFMKERLSYFHGSVDNFKEDRSNNKIDKFDKTDKTENFDLVTAMEVIEHVNSPSKFLEEITQFIKPGGYLVLSTINKTYYSYLFGILMAEKIFGIIPQGTHDWNKFIPPRDLIAILTKLEFEIVNLSGVSYNLFTSEMDFSHNTEVNYLISAKKKN